MNSRLERKETAISQRLRINRDIRVTRVRLIDSEGKQVGVLPTEQALQMATDAELDLVEVSPTADPPVCKIMDFGKFLYKQRKKEHEAKRKQVVIQIKEIRMRPKTDAHDRSIKVERARKFLSQGHRVQLNMLFRGREMAHMDLGRNLLLAFAEELEDMSKVESHPSRVGRRMSLMLAPRASIAEAYRREKREAAERHQVEVDQQKHKKETLAESPGPNGDLAEKDETTSAGAAS